MRHPKSTLLRSPSSRRGRPIGHWTTGRTAWPGSSSGIGRAIATLLALSVGLGLWACEQGPPAALRVVTAEEVGLLEQSTLIIGRDGGYSAVVWGRSVWVYGDTVLTVEDASGTNWHHNSYSITEDLDPTDGITGFEEPLDPAGAPAYFIHPTAEEEAFNALHRGDPCQVEPCGARWAVWPGPLVFDEARDRALVFYGLIYAEPGDFNFHGVGQSIALWERLEDSPWRPVVDPLAEHPTLLFGEGEPGFGPGAIIQGDSLYSFSCDSHGLDHPCLLAQAPLATVLDRDAWRYWDGSAWSAELSRAAPVFDGAPILTVAWNEALGLFLAVYSEPLENGVMVRTSEALTGPWSAEKKLFTAHRPAGGDGWVYDAVLHAEYSTPGDPGDPNDPGDHGYSALYVSHSRPTGEGWFNAELALWRIVVE